MANEISLSVRLTWSKSGAEIIGSVADTYDQDGDNAIENVQNIGSASEAIDIGDVTGSAYLMFKNLAPSWSSLTSDQQADYTDKADYETKNSVYIGTTNPTTSGNATLTLKPQRGTYFTTDKLAWYGIRDTNDVNLLVVAIEQ